jgi:hypothetical protein
MNMTMPRDLIAGQACNIVCTLELECHRLAKLCQERNAAYQGRYSSLAAGIIIDVIALSEGANRELQTHVCKAFNADIILVLADDKLHSSLNLMFRVRFQS